ncbi:MAG TPA: PRC-barrel domain-containing protein [Candidatus Sulfotelmatobacter sp.]|jgi:sporulation protein YlmC with PRC-barrel domain
MKVAHYGTLKNTTISDAAEDIRGSHLYGSNDEKLGKIDDVIFDHANGTIRYIVVDTGGWLTTKKFIVPADRLHLSAKHKDDFETPLSKEQIERFPPYKQSDLDSENTWADYEGRYRSKWESDPVMHRVGTDRNLTPTTLQMPGNSRSEAAAAEAHGWASGTESAPFDDEFETPVVEQDLDTAEIEAASEPTERAVPAGTDSVVIANSATGIGGRWDTFQSRLRERRKEAVASCGTCTGESATKRGAESVETLRKAV